MYYIVNSNNDPSCIAVSLYCENELISEANFFEKNSETRVDFQINTNRCPLVKYSFLNTACTEWNIGSYITVFGVYDNILLRFNGIASQNYTGSFSTLYGIHKGESWKAEKNIDGNEKWYSSSFDHSSWESVAFGSMLLNRTSYHFYKEFDIHMNYTAYEMRFFYQGMLSIYLNNHLLIENAENDKEMLGLSLVRSGDELIQGTNHLALILHCEGASTMDGWVGLYLNSDNLYLYPYSMTLIPNQESIDVKRLIDQNELTSVLFSQDQFFTAHFGGFRPAFTQMSFFVPYSYTFAVDSIHIVSDSGSVISRPTFYSLNNKEYNSFLMKTSVYEHLVVDFESSHNFTISELQFYIGRSSINETVRFDQEVYSFYLNFSPYMIHPVESLVGNCHADGQLPDCIVVDMHCVIRVDPSSEGEFPLVLKNDADSVVGEVTILIQKCKDRVIRSFRYYGSNEIPSELITMYDSNNEVVLKLDSRYQFTVNQALVFLCLKSDKYRIVVDDYVKEAWAENSYYQFDEGFWTGHVFYTRFRLDKRLNVDTEWELDLRRVLPVYSYWYCYSKRLIPLEWFDQSVEGWVNSTYSNYPYTEGQFQLFKRPLYIEELNVNMMELIVNYQYACLIVLNGEEIFRDGIKNEVITNATTAISSSDFIIPHRIRIPVHIHTHDNWVAIALIHSQTDPYLSHFDATIRCFFETKSFRLDDCTARFSSTSGKNPGDIFIMDSWKRTIWNTLWGETEHRIMYWATNVDHLKCIELHTTLTDANRLSTILGPTHFSIEGRRTDSLPWTPLFNTSILYWPATLSVQSFCFDQANYRQFVFKMNSQYQSFKVYSLRFYSVIMQHVSSVQYEFTSLVTNYNYDCIQSMNPYLSNYTVNGLPRGMGFDTLNGCLFGEITVFEHEDYSVDVTAYTVDHIPIVSTLHFTVTNCSHVGNLFLFSMYSLVHTYSPISWTVENELSSFSGSILASSQSLSIIPLCLQNSVYSFTLVHNLTSFNAELSVKLQATDTLFFNAYLAVSPNPFQFFMNAEVSLNAHSLWKQICTSSIPSEWYSSRFNSTLWNESEIASIHPTLRFILLRTTVPLDQSLSLTGFSFHLQYIGGVAVYINGRLVARYNINSPISDRSLPITPYTTTQKTLLTINLVDLQIQDSMLVGILYCRQDNEFPLRLEVVGKPCIADEIVTSSMNLFLLNPDMLSSVHNGVQLYYVADMLAFPEIAFNWEFSNMETTPMNVLFIRTSAVENLLVTLYCTNFQRGEGLILLSRYRISHSNYQYSKIPVDLGLLSCNQYTVLLSADYLTHYSFKIYQIYLYYDLTYEDSFCQRVGEWHAVKEGSISSMFCPGDQRGYLFSACVNNQFTNASSEHCYVPTPSSFTYSLPDKPLAINAVLPEFLPEFEGSISRFFSYNRLPEGLTLNSTTGALSGRINTTVATTSAIKIIGNNNNSTNALVSTTVSLKYDFYTCPNEGEWASNKTTSHYALFSCNINNRGIGIVKKHCTIFYNESFWDEEDFDCISSDSMFILLFCSFIAISLLPSLFRIFSRWLRKKQKIV